MLIEIMFKMLLFKGGVLIYAEHCIYLYIYNILYMVWCVCACAVVWCVHVYVCVG